MLDYPEAYTADNLYEILDANSAVPDEFGTANLERLVEIAQQRADARGNPLEDDKQDCLIGTDWTGFAGNEFGYSGGKLNHFAFGVVQPGISSGKDATLFTDVQVVQQDWLETGDGRKTQLEQYVDDDYDGADPGEMWIPDGAAQYIAIVVLSNELVHGEPTAADAM